MYEYFKGHLADVSPAYAVVDCGGVGYILNISLQTYSEISQCSEVLLYAHYIVREDAQILYGFSTRQERELFRSLISVSGVGGGTARMILSSYPPSELEGIIARGESAMLSRVKGLGTKTAQKIIVELRDKISAVGAAAAESGAQNSNIALMDEAVAALVMLGFTKQASEKVVMAIIKENGSAPVEDVIRLSLKRL